MSNCSLLTSFVEEQALVVYRHGKRNTAMEVCHCLFQRLLWTLLLSSLTLGHKYRASRCIAMLEYVYKYSAESQRYTYMHCTKRQEKASPNAYRSHRHLPRGHNRLRSMLLPQCKSHSNIVPVMGARPPKAPNASAMPNSSPHPCSVPYIPLCLVRLECIQSGQVHKSKDTGP